MLVEIGLIEKPDLDEFNRRGYYMVDAVKCPFQKGGGNATPPRVAIENCRSFLLQEISSYKPKVVCTLDKTSLGVFLNARRFRLSDYAGKFIENYCLKDAVAQLRIPILACWFPTSMVDSEIKLEAMRHLRCILTNSIS